MRRALVLIGLLPTLGGCATHLALRDDTIRVSNTLTDLQYKQVLDNVACNAVNYGTACFALTRFAALRCPAVADWIFGSPGGFSVFLCGQSRAFLLPRRT